MPASPTKFLENLDLNSEYMHFMSTRVHLNCECMHFYKYSSTARPIESGIENMGCKFKFLGRVPEKLQEIYMFCSEFGYFLLFFSERRHFLLFIHFYRGTIQ